MDRLRSRVAGGWRSCCFSAVVVGMGVGALTGCASGGFTPANPPEESASTPAPAIVATDLASAAEQAALAAYRAMWEAYDHAGEPPEADPDHPGLAAHASGDALQVLVDGVKALRDQSLVTAGEVVVNPQVVELSPEDSPARARIEDCADTSGSSRVRADGEPFEDEPGGRRSVVATVEITSDGVWKVIDFAVRSVGSC